MSKFTYVFILCTFTCGICFANEAEVNNIFKNKQDEVQTLGYFHHEQQDDDHEQYTDEQLEELNPEVIATSEDVAEEEKVLTEENFVEEASLQNSSTYVLDFDSDNSELSDDQQEIIKNVILAISHQPDVMLKIKSLGHSSDDSYVKSRSIALERAVIVRKILIDNDIDSMRVSIDAYEDMLNKSNKLEILLLTN